MDWSTTILGILAALFGGLNIFQFIFLRSTKKKYEAEGVVAEAEAGETEQAALKRRIESLETLYMEQSKVLETLRVDYLKLSQEKFQSEKRIVQLEGENKALREKVDRLEKDVNAYRTLLESK